jgi:hypothetical protein
MDSLAIDQQAQFIRGRRSGRQADCDREKMGENRTKRYSAGRANVAIARMNNFIPILHRPILPSRISTRRETPDTLGMHRTAMGGLVSGRVSTIPVDFPSLSFVPAIPLS